MSYPEAEYKYKDAGLDSGIKQLLFQKFLKSKGVFHYYLLDLY